ncbi:hypothetical protein JW977_02760 [Candidatus Falkowbacteria bacterium]|nr:hypothetical protein [Candidatus Falkowbacteria bacterium]
MENELKNNSKSKKPIYKKWWFWVIIFFFVMGIKGFIGNSIITTDNTNNPVNAPKEIENWKYGENVDKMTSEKIYYAYTTSTNRIDFDFPYNGGSNFQLLVRNGGKKNEILLSVSKGQFMTSIGYSDVRVKFDDNKPIVINYSSPSDGSYDTIFLKQSDTLISELKKSKKVIVEAEFFDEGNQLIEFNVEGFKWDK